MIKLLAFDLDGVLVDTEEIHYSALLRAINEFTRLSELELISLIKKDGKSTTEKLKLLKIHFGIEDSVLSKIDVQKQIYTVEMLKHVTVPNFIKDTLTELSKHYILTLVSNSRLSNVNLILTHTGLTHTFSNITTPDFGYGPKPLPDMYVATMRTYDVAPEQTLVLEDSPSGIEAGLRSGAYVMSINSLNDTNLTNINYVINQITHDSSSNGRKRKQIYSGRLS